MLAICSSSLKAASFLSLFPVYTESHSPSSWLCSHVMDSLDSLTGEMKWKRSLCPSLAERQKLLFLTLKGCHCQPCCPSTTSSSCSWCRDLSDSEAERKFGLNWHPREEHMVGKRRLCAHSGICRTWGIYGGWEWHRSEYKWRSSIQGKAPAGPGTSAVQAQWLIALLRTALAFSCWMRWFCSSSAKVFLHLSKGKFSQVGLGAGRARASEALQARNKSKAKPTCGTSTRGYWPLDEVTSELLACHRLLYFKSKVWGQSDSAHQGKVWVLRPSRWQRKCMPRGNSQSKGATSVDPEPEGLGV